MADSSDNDGADAPPTARTRRITFKTQSGQPVSLYIGTRFPDRETFMRRFAPMVGPGGMFVVTQSTRRVGDRLSFAVTLADETAMLEGEVEVLEVRTPDPARPDRKGMRLRFLQLSPLSREIVDEMVRQKREPGSRTDPSFPVAPTPLAADLAESPDAAPPEIPEVSPKAGEPARTRATQQGIPTVDAGAVERAEASQQLTLLEAPAPLQGESSTVRATEAAMIDTPRVGTESAPPIAPSRPRPPGPPPPVGAARSLPAWLEPPPAAMEPTALAADANPPPSLDVTLDLRPASDGTAQPASLASPASFPSSASLPTPARSPSSPSFPGFASSPSFVSLASSANMDRPSQSESGRTRRGPPVALPLALSFKEGPATPGLIGSESPPLDPPPTGIGAPRPHEERRARPAAGSELRTPGSPLILEANPLADIDDDMLRGFIDDMLLDGTGRKRSPSLLGLKPLAATAPPDTEDAEPSAAAGATLITVAPQSATSVNEGATAPPTAALAPAHVSPTLSGPAPARKGASPLFLVVAATATLSLAAGIGLALLVRAGKAPPTAAPASPPPPVRVVEKIAVAPPPAPPPAPPLCTLDVRSDPTGFHVRWNGEDRGITPATLTQLPCGEAGELTLGGGHFRPFSQHVTPTHGSPSHVEAKLIAARPRLMVWSRPADAEVILDGKKVGLTPYQVEVKSGAEIKIEVEKSGFKPWTSTVLVRNQFNSVSLVLEPLPAP